ncbi:helix-turn-helix domain-containing protein [Phytoactinopolyspora mesophila]|uniref:Helix-turn-helix domain-containing protein n=1 Tax=Phytoactinopolyspora mesophila TaxID=2650750 RepID=A0A7K3M3G6_9ACTN|nr:helix-turn-helix transcriptional regulator [Phytoactinopolyspora mesophila]NDL57849.1 helix-turn-helix domain-containing protein [Phytoactinopolyspora mesophila]
MANKTGYVWHLRRVMADRGMFQTTDLIAPLAERGAKLSREQVYRLVTGTPERLNLAVLAALCDILDCSVGDLIEPRTSATPTSAKTSSSPEPPERLRPRRARILPEPGQ